MTIAPVDLTTRLGRWEQGRGPLYRQLTDALRSLLESGALPRGSALPAERTLASALSVSRTTVSAAYAELRSEGWLDARQGSATTVAMARHSPFGAHRANGIFATLLERYDVDIDLTINVPTAAPIVSAVLAEPGRYLPVDELTEGHGYHPAGHPRLRGALARLLTARGLETRPEQVLVTSGAQQAVALAIRGLARPGDPVAIEETTYPGALDVISESGMRAVPLTMTEQGVSLDAVTSAIRNETPRLLYLIPSFHNPTSALLSSDDRRRLVRTIRKHRMTTIEDMTVADLDFDVADPPPLAAFDSEASVVTVGSLSKVYWGGLRVGWLRAHEAVVGHLAGLKVTADMGTSSPTQAMAAAMLEHHAATKAWRHDRLRRSLDALTGALELHLPDWEWQRPAGGPQLWVRLPGVDASGFAQRALRSGIALVPGPFLSAAPGLATDRIRIPLYPSPGVLEEAVHRLSALWQTFGASGSQTPARRASTGSRDAARSEG